jgi:electron transfer flavoprotein beta subunit
MNIVVPIKFVPDLVEELIIDDGGSALDSAWLSLIMSEFDDHAIEQAILLKEKYGGHVTVITFETERIDNGADRHTSTIQAANFWNTLCAAVAKGADRLIKITGLLDVMANNHTKARLLADVIAGLQPTLILTGVQAHNDLDGPIGPLLAEYLELPYIGYVAGVENHDDKLIVLKEYPGGLLAELETTLPAVLGIQAANSPPRYVAFSKIRQAMKSASIEEHPVTVVTQNGGPIVKRMFQPDLSERATIIEGEPDEAAARLVELLGEKGIL